MKRCFWYGILGLLLLSSSLQAQSLAGEWQGVETDTREMNSNWPAVLRLQQSKSAKLLGVLYQEVGGEPGVSVTFQMAGTRTGKSLRLDHVRKLNETGRTPVSHWCEGFVVLTYDASQEKLTGEATYQPVGNCDVGTFTFYRIKLKSSPTVAAGAESTLRVSGREVQWFADADLKQPVHTGNTYRIKLSKTTTFYLTQGYYATSQSPVVPITIRVSAAVGAKPAPAPARAILAPKPVVLPTVLFKLGTSELLPEALPALDQLAAELKARPALQLRVAGHTDKIGEPQKNQVLSEQRAEVVKAYLVKAGTAAGRISTIGYGDARPLHPSPDARNRRVEVEVVR